MLKATNASLGKRWSWVCLGWLGLAVGAGVVGAEAPATRPAVVAPASSQELERRIDAELRRHYRDDEPGVAVLVMKDGQPILRRGYGLAHVELKVPVQPEMVFRLGSITKQFTAVAILMLVEQGKLTLDTPLSAVLPECPAAAKDLVTIRHLLTHTSGIASYTDKHEFFAAMGRQHTHAEMLAYFAGDPLQFTPGERFAYSNSGYYLLGMVIEKITGRSYAEFVEQQIFAKLGMRHSFYDLPHKQIPGRVQGYEQGEEGYHPAPHLDMNAPYAAGSLASSVDDLALWDQALYGETLLRRDTLAEAWKPFAVTGPQPSSYGFGWSVGEYQGRPVQHHNGGINGFSTSMLRIPSEKLLVVALSNGHQANPEVMAQRAAMMVLGDGKDFRPISLPAEKLATFEGVYFVDPQTRRVVRVRDGQLTSQRTGGPVFQLLPLAEREFLFADQNDRVVFELDAQGKPAAMVMHRWGELPERSPITAEPLPAERKAIELTEAELDRVVGEYELQPGFVLAVRREGKKLITQATGQAPIEVHAASATEFFLTVVDAQLIFALEGDRAQSVTLLQGGARLIGKRLP